MGNFHNMEIWKESKNLAVKIYKLTNKGKFINDLSFRDQIRKAAVSIPSNLAEGEESGLTKGSLRYFHIANGSLAELRTQIEIAKEIGYIRDTEYIVVQNNMTILAKRLMCLIQFRQRKLDT